MGNQQQTDSKLRMTVYGVLVTLVISVDFIVAGLILSSWLWVFGSLCLVGLAAYGIYVYRCSRTSNVASGWTIGPGVEISDPNRPEAVNIVLPQKTLDLGFLGIGSPGSGKTVSLGVGYIQDLKRRMPDRPWAIIDGKGDIDFYLSLIKAGCKPRYFLSSELAGSDSINLFAGEAADVVDRCLRFLIPTTASTSFYSDAQRATLDCLVPAFKQLGVESSLRDLHTVLSIEPAGQEFMSLVSNTPGIGESDVTMVREWFKVPFIERFALNKGLINRLSVFCAGQRNDRLNVYQPDIDIGSAMDQGETVFFHLPYSEFSKDIAVAVVEMFGVEARKRQLSGPDQFKQYPLLFEDYGGFFHENFGPISSRCRSACMPLNFTFQSLAQLQKVNESFKDELDDNLPTKIVFRVMGMNTSNFAVRMLGDFETRELSSSDYGQRDNINLQHVREDRIVSRQLRELAPGEAFVSTIRYQTAGGTVQVKNPLYKVQFPSPLFDDAIEAELPPVRTYDEGVGLGFWSKYMSPSRLREINARLHEDMLREAEVV